MGSEQAHRCKYTVACTHIHMGSWAQSKHMHVSTLVHTNSHADPHVHRMAMLFFPTASSLYHSKHLKNFCVFGSPISTSGKHSPGAFVGTSPNQELLNGIVLVQTYLFDKNTILHLFTNYSEIVVCDDWFSYVRDRNCLHSIRKNNCKFGFIF